VSQAIPNQVSVSSRFWADFNLLSVAVLWGINATVMKYGISQVDPFVFNAIRLTVSAIALWFCLLVENRRNRHRPMVKQPRQLVWWVIGFSFLSGAIYQITFLTGIFKTTAGNTALIMSSCPMWTAGLAVLTTSERLSRAAWVGLSVTLVGTVFVIAQKSEFSTSAATLTGNLIVLAAALAWSISSVVSKPLLNHVSAIRLAFFSIVITLPLHWLLAIPNFQKDCEVAFSPWVFASILYSGFFSTGVAYAMWNYGIQKLGAPHASIYQNVIPIVAVISAWWMIGETPLPLQIWGGVLIIGGLFIMRRGRQMESSSR
jgi:drug/metabolite transporter (DMT)-like permease